MRWLILFLMLGCTTGNDALSVSEVRRLKESGYDVYACILTKGIMAHQIFGTASSTIWLVVPKETPVKVQFADCDILKLE